MFPNPPPTATKSATALPNTNTGFAGSAGLPSLVLLAFELIAVVRRLRMAVR